MYSTVRSCYADEEHFTWRRNRHWLTDVLSNKFCGTNFGVRKILMIRAMTRIWVDYHKWTLHKGTRKTIGIRKTSKFASSVFKKLKSYLRNIVSSFLNDCMEPSQYKKSLGTNRWFSTFNEFWRPWFISSLQILLYTWRWLQHLKRINHLYGVRTRHSIQSGRCPGACAIPVRQKREYILFLNKYQGLRFRTK